MIWYWGIVLVAFMVILANREDTFGGIQQILGQKFYQDASKVKDNFNIN